MLGSAARDARDLDSVRLLKTSCGGVSLDDGLLSRARAHSQRRHAYGRRSPALLGLRHGARVSWPVGLLMTGRTSNQGLQQYNQMTSPQERVIDPSILDGSLFFGPQSPAINVFEKTLCLCLEQPICQHNPKLTPPCEPVSPWRMA